MYGLRELRNLPQKRGDTETMPYVARELSWELARYLEAQDSPEDASAASNTAGGRPGWTPRMDTGRGKVGRLRRRQGGSRDQSTNRRKEHKR